MGDLILFRRAPFFLDRIKRHLLGGTARCLLPIGKQSRVILRDVVCGRYPQLLRGCINPSRWAFYLAKVTDRDFVYDHLSLLVAPLRAEFFVAKCWDVP